MSLLACFYAVIHLKLAIKMQKVSSSSPKPPTGALPLEPTGGLPSPKPLLSPSRSSQIRP